MSINLNNRASRLVDLIARRAEELRISPREVAGGGLVLDFGVEARGGLAAGLELARVCMSDLAEVTLLPGEVAGRPCPVVTVHTDHPIAACLASQYAGWALSEGKFFAMASGPIRAARGHEEIFDRIGFRERANRVVGVLEGRKLPSSEIVSSVAQVCGVPSSSVVLLIAPTASLAGNLQVVARSAETALHKLAELGFDLDRISAVQGAAPLPPVASDDLAAIGRTNDAILYGARVVIDVTGDDDSIASMGPRVPSSASRDFGEPFASIFARYNHDFYAVDPRLFSPAQVEFRNIETGCSHVFGRPEPDVMARSFYT